MTLTIKDFLLLLATYSFMGFLIGTLTTAVMAEAINRVNCLIYGGISITCLFLIIIWFR